jgi:hydrogenase large subunit
VTGEARPQSNGNVRHIYFEPLTRVAGGLAFRATVDLEQRRVLDARALATLFRGYEIILEGRDPRDAIFVSSRACGVCGGVHSTTSALCLEMALGIHPPPLGIAARNLLLSIEYLCDYPLHLFVRAGCDYSERAVTKANPELWEQAQEASCRGGAVHGYRKVSDIMSALARLEGELYGEALHMSRAAREAYVLIGGKYPHPQTVVPGGISSTIDASDMLEAMRRITKFFDYGQKVVAIWDDLTDFFYSADPRYREVGRRPTNLIDLGQWDDPLTYDGTFENAPAWGERRWATPGIVVDGKLVTTDLQQINAGIEEFADHSFYADWTTSMNGDGRRTFETDPAGNPLSRHHPWNKQTIPVPGRTSRTDRYSWATAPRWNRHVMETGAHSRLWITALAGKLPHPRFLEPTGHSLRFTVPKATLPEAELEWAIPDSLGAFERNRARAYGIVHSALVAYENLLVGLDLIRKGNGRIFTAYKVPKDSRVGVGFGGAGGGYLSHHATLDRGVIESYQILTPSTFTASPRDRFGKPGPCEEAVAATPLLGTRDIQIDLLRAIRSFDPCGTCATH